jgi:tryptophan synthase alpha chain
MNRIDELFQRKDRNVLSVYFTAGYPKLSDTNLIIKGLEEAGADLIEIGFPFSDPVADGPVIQASSHQALENGMNLDILFGQLREIRETSRIPKVMMGYFNTVYQYGVEKFIVECGNSGVSGVILPDLPPEVYLDEYQEIFEKHGIHFICLVSPQTPTERAEYLATISKGFLYILSMSGTTGARVREDLGVIPVGKRATAGRPYGTPPAIPTLIGFGIHDHQSFGQACGQANGAIIGSEFIRRLNDDRRRQTADGRGEGLGEVCEEFVNEIRGKV